MDLSLPVMDAFQATHAIRALPGHESTPILAMAANVLDEDGRLCRDAGMNDHVAEPFEPEVLYESALRWLPRE